MKILELMAKEKELIQFGERYGKVKYLEALDEDEIWRDYKPTLQHSNEMDQGPFGFDETNKQLLSRMNFKYIQGQTGSITELAQRLTVAESRINELEKIVLRLSQGR